MLVSEGAYGPLESDKDWEARSTFEKAKKQGVGRGRKDGCPKHGGGKVREGRHVLNSVNCRAGLRSGRYRRDSEYRPAPECPRRNTPQGNRGPPPQERSKARKLSYSAFSIETRVSAQRAEHLGSEDAKSACEQFFATAFCFSGLLRGIR